MKFIASAVAKINIIFLILAIITIAVVNGDSSHLKKCEGDWERNTANGKCYKIFYDEPVSFMECASKCVSYNASMLCIKNADENDFYGSKMRGRADREWIKLGNIFCNHITANALILLIRTPLYQAFA